MEELAAKEANERKNKGIADKVMSGMLSETWASMKEELVGRQRQYQKGDKEVL